MISVSEARERIVSAMPRIGEEMVALDQAYGRIVAAAVRATRALPPYDNSAMDGFAVRSAEVPGTLPIAGTIAAGASADGVLDPGTVQRIMTGAPLPAGADAVVMRENVDDRGDHAVFAQPVRVGRDIRRAGEDIAAGEVIASPGQLIDAGLVGVLAAQGISEVPVARRPRVAILSTGDELVDVATTPGSGQIVSSNAYALAAQIREAGGEPVDAGIARDNLDDSIAKLRAALDADVLVSCGGVSVGDFDFVKEAFAATGVTVEFWKVAVKPGKPLVFGHGPGGVPVFGLPGNPVSAMVTFELFTRPALLAMQGAATLDRPRAPVILASAYRKDPGRAHYLRARVRRDGTNLVAEPLAKQGSGMLSSMVGIDALVEFPREAGPQPAGATVEALLLRAL